MTVKTSSLSHHLGIFVYPWKLPYPIEGQPTKSSETLPRILINTIVEAGKPGTGITYCSFSRRKDSVGGTMEVDFQGTIDPVVARIGNWVVFNTSAKRPILKPEDGVVRFIGQIYAVNSQFFADAEGNLRKTIKLSIREWSHVLHTPVKIGLYSAAAQGDPVQRVQNVAGILSKSKLGAPSASSAGEASKAPTLPGAGFSKESGEISKALAKSFFNVFVQPYIALSFIGGVSAKDHILLNGFTNGAFKEVFTAPDSFKDVSSRLPILPATLIEDFFTHDTVDPVEPNKPWSTGFMEVMSGVQTWPEGLSEFGSDGISGDLFDTLKDKAHIDANAKRPIAQYNIQHLIDGGSLASIVNRIMNQNSPCENYTDLWYIERPDGSIKAQPVYVIRDLPFSMKDFSSNTKYPWTYMDNLPRATLPAENIITVNIGHTALNSKNLVVIQIDPSSGVDLALARAESTYYGTVILDESQKRFGGAELNLSIRDVIEPNPDKSRTAIKSVQDSWFKDLADRHTMWYGSDYMFYNVSLQIKDSDFLISCGNNVQFRLRDDGPIVVGHVTGLDYRYKVVDGGLVSNTSYVYLSRVCMAKPESNTLYPLPNEAATNLLDLRENILFSEDLTAIAKTEALNSNVNERSGAIGKSTAATTKDGSADSAVSKRNKAKKKEAEAAAKVKPKQDSVSKATRQDVVVGKEIVIMSTPVPASTPTPVTGTSDLAKDYYYGYNAQGLKHAHAERTGILKQQSDQVKLLSTAKDKDQNQDEIESTNKYIEELNSTLKRIEAVYKAKYPEAKGKITDR